MFYSFPISFTSKRIFFLQIFVIQFDHPRQNGKKTVCGNRLQNQLEEFFAFLTDINDFPLNLACVEKYNNFDKFFNTCDAFMHNTTTENFKRSKVLKQLIALKNEKNGKLGELSQRDTKFH